MPALLVFICVVKIHVIVRFYCLNWIVILFTIIILPRNFMQNNKAFHLHRCFFVCFMSRFILTVQFFFFDVTVTRISKIEFVKKFINFSSLKSTNAFNPVKRFSLGGAQWLCKKLSNFTSERWNNAKGAAVKIRKRTRKGDGSILGRGQFRECV